MIALVAAMLGSVFTYSFLRWAEPRPSLAQPSPPGLDAAVMDSQAIERAAAAIGPSVVNIDTQTTEVRNPHSQEFMRRFFGDNPPQPGPDKERGVGSGVIVSRDGYVLTNEHVIHGTEDIKVTLTNHTHYKATVVGADKLSDIAIVKIDAHDLPAAVLGDSSDVKVGQWVVAVGNPYQFEHTVTVGVISGRGRSLPDSVKEYRDLLQTDAAINPGNSGGPLCDLAGRVIGINTAIIPYAQGIGFSIPVNAAHAVMNQLIAHGHVIRPYIGITMQAVNDDAVKELHLPRKEGVLVVGIVPDSPAMKAGLQRGDVIVRFDGQKFESLTDFQRLVRSKTIGQVQSLEYYRDGKLRTAQITVAEMPDVDKLQQMH